MSQFSNRDRDSGSPTPTSAPPIQTRQDSFKYDPPTKAAAHGASSVVNLPSSAESPSPQRLQRERAQSLGRPMSMAQTYQPPLMDINQDTLPELQPIFTFLNSHSNKLYQEGYFLKLDDQNTRMCSPLFLIAHLTPS